MTEAARRVLKGRRRPSGAVGIRHHVLIIPSVLCAAQAALEIAGSTAGAVAIAHQHGCSQLGGDAHLTEQILGGLGTHPNVAGALVVSLGCETVQGILLHRAIESRGQRARFVGIQQAGGTLAAIEAGRGAVAELLQAAAADPEVPAPWTDLRIGVEGTWLGLPPHQAQVFVQVIDELLARGATVIQAVPTEPDRDPRLKDTEPVSPPPYLAAHRVRPIPYATGVDPAAPPGRARTGRIEAGGDVFLMPAPETRIAQKTGLAAAGAHVILSPLVAGLPAGCPVAPVVHVGIAPYARPFAHDVEVLLDEDPRPGAAGAIVDALGAACRDETVMEALGAFEMAIHRIAPTM